MFASILSDMALLCFYAKDTPCRSFWKIRVCDYPTAPPFTVGALPGACYNVAFISTDAIIPHPVLDYRP
jgi:hypothetical protein